MVDKYRQPLRLFPGTRMESYSVELLDENDRSRGKLNGVLHGGQVTQNYDSVIRGACKLDLQITSGIDFMKDRFRVWATVNGVSWPLGVFLPDNPEEKHSGAGVVWPVDGLDKTSILDNDAYPFTYSVKAGAVVTTEVDKVIRSTGETTVTITPSAKTTQAQMVWPPGTSKLTIVNDLLASIGYDRVWADGYGQFRCEPYVDADKRPITQVFQRGETSIHSPEWSYTQDISGVPNMVVCTTQGDETTPGLTATAVNEKPDSPYSIQNRGRTIVKAYTGVEATDLASLKTIASRNLWNSSTPPAYYSVKHAVVDLKCNEVVRFVSHGHDARAVVNEFTVTLEAGSLVSAKWLEVQSVA